MSVNKGLSIYKNGASGVTPEDVEQLILQNGKGVFYADYNITSRDDVMAAINDGKSIICRRTNNDSSTDYATLDFKGGLDDLEFFGVHDSKILKFTLSSADVWSYQETTIGGDNPILFYDENVYYDDINWNAIVTANKLIIIRHEYQNYCFWIAKYYWESFVILSCIPWHDSDSSTSNNGIKLGYYIWTRNSGQTKGGQFRSNYQRRYIDILFPPFSGGKRFAYRTGNDNTTVQWGSINEVPTTSGHYNQTLRSKNDGSYGWEPTINDIRLYYDSTWKIDKNYTDIKSLINLDRPVRVKLEVGTNDNIYLDFVRDYTNSGTQATDYLIFQKNLIDVAAGSMDCYTLKIMGDNTISYTHTIYTM